MAAVVLTDCDQFKKQADDEVTRMECFYECIPCFQKQVIEAAKMVTEDEMVLDRIIRRTLKQLAIFDYRLSPPHMVQIIHRIVKDETNNKDPYRSIKQRSIEEAKRWLPIIRDRVERSNDPLEAAIRYAIAGNIMDFAMSAIWDREKIDKAFSLAEVQPIDRSMINELVKQLNTAETILYLADNAGESVIDRLLLERLSPTAQVYYGVKGAPIINDVTADDAKSSGIESCATVISNGNDAPGNIIEKCSSQFQAIFNSADVVIAKGQANFETLVAVRREVFLLTQIKCSTLAEHYGYQLGDWVLNLNTLVKK